MGLNQLSGYALTSCLEAPLITSYFGIETLHTVHCSKSHKFTRPTFHNLPITQLLNKCNPIHCSTYIVRFKGYLTSRLREDDSLSALVHARTYARIKYAPIRARTCAHIPAMSMH